MWLLTGQNKLTNALTEARATYFRKNHRKVHTSAFLKIVMMKNLHKKLQDLESQLHDFLLIPAVSQRHKLVARAIKKRLLFLKKIVSAEFAAAVSSECNEDHHHLEQISQRLKELENALHSPNEFIRVWTTPTDFTEEDPSCIEFRPGSLAWEEDHRVMEMDVVEEKEAEGGGSLEVAAVMEEIRGGGEKAKFWRWREVGVIVSSMLAGAVLMMMGVVGFSGCFQYGDDGVQYVQYIPT